MPDVTALLTFPTLYSLLIVVYIGTAISVVTLVFTVYFDRTKSTSITRDECTKPQFIGLLTAILYIKNLQISEKGDITQLSINVLLSNITFFLIFPVLVSDFNSLVIFTCFVYVDSSYVCLNLRVSCNIYHLHT